MFLDSPQHTDEWLKERAGHFTASSANDLFMGKTTQTYNDLINKVIFEKLTGTVINNYQTPSMLRGIELEEQARIAYEELTFSKVEQVGFYEVDEWIGCSVDGLVDKNIIVEIKCLEWNTHLRNMLADKVELKYLRQCQFQLMCLKREAVDFFSYHPDFRPLYKRIYRDEKMIDEIKVELKTAIETAQRRLNSLK